ncbi:error-prone DNA polymerase [Streptomyces sp. CG 926]|nr:hypothetical protein [Streptomyces sp. CG 926]PWK64438.1 error-prone DNA polymerase [Streptomyces sp. CG 926]
MPARGRAVIVSDARHHDIPVLAVDIDHSAGDHRIEETGSRGCGLR